MKYPLLLGALLAFYSGCVTQDFTSQTGYIFTCPKSLKMGTSNELHFKRFGNREPGVLNVVIENNGRSDADHVAAEKSFPISAGQADAILNLTLNNLGEDAYDGKIKISGMFGNYNISGMESITFLSPKTSIIIIQTDKPIYQPGQTVKFRVLKLDENLRPSKEEDFADVYIEDPKGTRLFQFKGLNLDNGIVQNEFPLSDESLKGTWRIKATAGNSTESTSFDVKEYALPKFDVSIKFPSFVLSNAETVPVQICAKYTYGEPVAALLNLTASIESYYYQSNKDPILQESVQIKGCYNYNINISQIEPDNEYSSRQIKVTVTVIEDGTGVQRNASQSISRSTNPLTLKFSEDQLPFFKPGLPYNGILKVSNPDNTPAAGEPIQMCGKVRKQRILAEWFASKELQFCKNYTSDANGLVQYTVLSQNPDETSISLDAKSTKYLNNPSRRVRATSLSQPQTSTSLNPYFSPSGSFIQLQPPRQQPVPCGTQLPLKLLFTSTVNDDCKIIYQVTKDGDVITSSYVETYFDVKNDVSKKFENDDRLVNSKENQTSPPLPSHETSAMMRETELISKETRYKPYVGEVDINIKVDATLSPGFSVIAYYIRDDREVVADTIKIDVEKCFRNKVGFTFGDKKQKPGLQTSIHVSAAPHSLCGIKAVDKSISLLDNRDQLTKDKVFQKLRSLNNDDFGSYGGNGNPCYQDIPQPGLKKAPPKPSAAPQGFYGSSYEDSLSTFQSFGFVVISDLTLFTRPCLEKDFSSGGYRGGYGRGSVEYITAEYATGEYETGEFISGEVESEEDNGRSNDLQSAKKVRDFFPETWLFELDSTGPEGKYTAEKTLPDTITEWIGSAVCISPEEGLGISNTTSITAFQSFFIDYTLPTSVRRGEEFLLVVTVASYANSPLPIRVTLDDPEGFTVTSSSLNRDVCIQPSSRANLQVMLKATKLGKVNITVQAETSQSSNVCGNSPTGPYARDAITKPIEVEPEGFPAEDVINTLFCPSDGANSVYDKTITLSVPKDVIPDSARAIVDFTGNVMGKAIQNIDYLVSLPTGCGEQNLVKFAPNYIVLDYLKSIGMLTSEIQSKAINNLNKGYGRELTYRHRDGSFSAFGETDKTGSLFLTAFVLRSFYEAKRYIYIDDNVLNKMEEWIASKQKKDGCFPNIGQIVDVGLDGGVGKDKSSGGITAYVLASLYIADYKNENVTGPALTCLDNNPPSNPYATVLYAYAKSLAGKNDDARKLIADARQRINKTDGVEYFMIDGGSEATEIETDAYAILTTLQLDGSAAEAVPYVRYLTNHFNPYGGFQATQDTCVGLDALAKFAKLVYRDPLNLKVTITGGLAKTVQLTNNNKLLVQRFEISKVPNDVEIKATGTGCGLMQASVRYNTRTPPEKKMFSIDVNGTCSNVNCTQATIETRVSYLPPGLRSGMSIVEVKLITGFAAVKDSLDKLKSKPNSQITQADVEDNMVVFYFNAIGNKLQSFTFEVEQVVVVKNAQPGTAKVYDYYANENSSTTSYTIKGLNSMAQLNGDGQKGKQYPNRNH